MQVVPRGCRSNLTIVSRKALTEAARKHADLEAPLGVWYRVAKTAQWRSLEEIRKTWAGTDCVRGRTVFNIKGNSYRLIAGIHYESRTIFIKHVLTHAEYNKGDWK
ncbi:MAG: type II toxin-antitoxin system HigB family toxin [Bryobacteraceae bacterium]